MIKRILILTLMSLAVFRPEISVAQTKWVMATAYADGNFHTQNILKFAEDVRTLSNGALEIRVLTNQSLLKMPEIMRGVQTGQVQLGEVLISAYGNEDPFFEVDTIPYLARGYSAARKVWEASRPYIEARLKKRNVGLLFSVAWPSQGLYTKSEIGSLDYFKGIKFRAYNPSTTRFAQLMGALPVTVQSAEVAQAFATGVVNAMVTSAQTGVDTQVWDFARHYLNAELMNAKNMVIVNERALHALPAASQAAVREAAVRAEARGWEMSQKAEVASLDTLKQKGVIVVMPSDALVAGLQRVSGQMIQEWTAKAGADGEKFVRAIR